MSTPSTRSYGGQDTAVSISQISAAGPTMTAAVTVSPASPVSPASSPAATVTYDAPVVASPRAVGDVTTVLARLRSDLAVLEQVVGHGPAGPS